MPTATSTRTKAAYSTQIPLKGSIPVVTPPVPTPVSSSTTTATLRTLYNRAARAFLLRDISLALSLIESAFSIIEPSTVVSDHLADHRRKWDILRITLESTVYSSPPQPPDALPDPLRESLLQPPQAVLTAMYTRSLALFTPAGENTNAGAAFIPSQVLITLVYSSLRINCPDVGRVMIENWLSRRNTNIGSTQPSNSLEAKGDGYEKVLELYCLQILPKLEQWEYAHEFLEYEGELPDNPRENLRKSLKSLHAEAMSSRRPQFATTTSSSASASSPRPYSPTPSASSASSSSSSLSTTSTHTIVPSSHRRPIHPLSTSTSMTSPSASATSLSSDSTATPHQTTGRPTLKSRTTKPPMTSQSNHVPLSLPRSHPQAAALRPPNLNIFALVRASLAPYLTTSNLSTIFFLFVVLPLTSVILRARHRKRRALNGGRAASNAQLVRRRLQTTGEAGVFGRAWGEVIRAVGDAIRMAGSGLV